MVTVQNRFHPLKNSLFKKANQIATSCGAEIAIILFRVGKSAITFHSRNVDLQQITMEPAGLCIFKLNCPTVDVVLTKSQNIPFSIEINNKGEIWWRKDVDTLDLAQLRLFGENLKTLKQKVINAIKEKQAATEASAKTAQWPQQSSSYVPYAGDLQAQQLNQTLQTSPSFLAATEASGETAQRRQQSSSYFLYAGDLQAQQLNQTLQTSLFSSAASEASAETAQWPHQSPPYFPCAGNLQAQQLYQTLQTSPNSLAATEASAETAQRLQKSSSHFPYAGNLQARQLNQTLQTSPSSLAASKASAGTAQWSQQSSSYFPRAVNLQAQQLNQTLQTKPSSIAATEASAKTAQWPHQSSYLPYAGDIQAQQLNQTLQTSQSSLAATEASAETPQWPRQSSSCFPYASDLQAQQLNQTLQTSPSSLAATEASAETAQRTQQSSSYSPYAGDLQAQQLNQTLQISPFSLAATEASAETAQWPQQSSSYLPYAGDLQAQQLNQTLQTSPSSFPSTSGTSQYDMVGSSDIHGKRKALANTLADSRFPWVNRVQQPYFSLEFDNPSSSMFGSADPIRQSFGHFNPPGQQFTIPSMEQFNNEAAIQFFQDGNYGVKRQFPGYEHAPNFSNIQPKSIFPPSADDSLCLSAFAHESLSDSDGWMMSCREFGIYEDLADKVEELHQFQIFRDNEFVQPEQRANSGLMKRRRENGI